MAKPQGHRDFHSRTHSGSCTRSRDKSRIERGSKGHNNVGSSSPVSCQNRPPARPQDCSLEPHLELYTHFPD